MNINTVPGWAGRHSLRAMVAVMLLIGLSAGCIDTRQPSRKIDLYTPAYPPPSAAGEAPLPVVLRVDRFSAAPELNTNRMAYKESDNRLDYYNYHQWLATPADIVTYFLARDLRATGRFAGVGVPGSGVPPSHRIEGVVDGFYEIDGNGGQWFSEATLTITLVRDREPDVSRRVVFQKTYRQRQRLDERSPSGVAKGMGRCLGALSEEIARDVFDRLKSGT